jgi:hypothetical protein
MKGKTNARGKRKATAKVPVETANSRVKLKKTTRLMLWMAHFFKRAFYTQEGRNTKADFYREGRRLGVLSNRELMGIETRGGLPSTMKFRESMRDLVESGRLGPCSDDPPAPFTSRRSQEAVEDDVTLEVGGAVNEDDAVASSVPRVEETVEDGELEPETSSLAKLPTPKSHRRIRRTATRQSKLQLSLGFE